MAQSFDETAHLKTDMKAYHEGWERIFGSNKPDTICDSDRMDTMARLTLAEAALQFYATRENHLGDPSRVDMEDNCGDRARNYFSRV